MITFSFADKSYETDRVIGKLTGSEGPALVFIGGMHGNERSGVIALQQVFAELSAGKVEIKGQMIGLAGNLPALSENKRFIAKDLNRIWDDDFSRQYRSLSDQEELLNGDFAEEKERHELFQIMDPLMKQDGLSFFIDLHTTSAPSVPFIAINDQLSNRKFALQFPIPTVLGIEEYLSGPLLSYLNDFGHVALAFEAGQHDDPDSIQTHVSFIYLAMLAAGVVNEQQIPDLSEHRLRLEKLGHANHSFFEVIFRKAVSDEDEFVMNPGYNNFAPISKGELLARDRNGNIEAHRPGRIFMPLYQADGNDGFFIVRQVPGWALKLSSVLRKLNFQHVLTWLPGVSRCKERPDAIVVKKKIARFLSVEIFHLLGYRRKQDDGNEMIFVRREVE